MVRLSSNWIANCFFKSSLLISFLNGVACTGSKSGPLIDSAALRPSSGSGSLACTEDTPITESCYVENKGAYLGQLGSDITQWPLIGSQMQLRLPIPNGYYEGKKISLSDSDLLPSNIRLGKNIFGVAGTYEPIVNIDFKSTMNRTVGSNVPSINQQQIVEAGQPYPIGAGLPRPVPNILYDYAGTHANYPYTGPNKVGLIDRTNWDDHCYSLTGLSPGSEPCRCGVSGSIEERIAACAQHPIIGPQSTWIGAIKGKNSESTWKLVVRQGAPSGSLLSGLEVWRDERTKLLWSSLVAVAVNWCKASGKNNIPQNPAAENDPADICDTAPNQAVTGRAQSVCFEDIDDGSSNDKFTHPPFGDEYDDGGKAGLGISSNPRVAWRLPTYSDFLQASVDGIQFVLPDSGNSEWTATPTMDVGHALRFEAVFISGVPFLEPGPVRCVGR